MARIVESMTALMISINARYKTHAGVKITALPDDLWPVALMSGPVGPRRRHRRREARARHARRRRRAT